MKAITYAVYGPAEVLQLAELEAPTPREDEILVRVHAVEATKADTELRSFNFPVKWFSWLLRLFIGVRRPKRKVLGSYFAGVVEAVGSAGSRFHVGDEIFGSSQMRFGAYGEYLTLPGKYPLTTKPNNSSFEEAAAIPLGGFNALHFMRLAKIEPGQRVLVNGGGGSIGSFGLQIAKSLGAHVTVVDAPHKEALVNELGADEFIDYTQQDFSERGERYDVIFDMVVGSSYSKCLSVLNDEGCYLCGNPTLRKMFRILFTSFFSKKRATFAFANETQEELETLRDMFEAGKLRAGVGKVLPLEKAVEAHRLVESEQREGIVVLSLA